MASKRIFDIIFKTKGTDRAKSAVKGIGGALGTLTKVSVLAGAGIAALSVKLAGDFSKNLREVSTLMDNTSEKSIKKMSKELRLLSQTSGLALSSLSKAKYDVVSAGFADASESAQILAASTQLAVGGVTSASAAADLLTTSLNAYGLSANQVNDVSDVLFTTVRLGKTTMDELAGSLGKVLPVAKSSGVSLSAVGAAMASLTAGGINTAESTTALRSAIMALTAPVGASAKAMADAKIEAKRFEDGSLDLLGTIKQFEGMDPAALRKFIPDISASVAISSLANNVEGLSDNLIKFEERAGASETAFNKMAGEFNTQMAMLKNTSQSVMIEIGNVIIDAILPSVKQANEALATMGEIGWDVVAKRLEGNMSHIKNVAVQSFEVLAAELGIVGQRMISVLPGFLGGSDKKAAANIEQYEKEIKDRIAIIKFELNLLATEATKPLPKPTVEITPEDLFGDMDFSNLDIDSMLIDPEVTDGMDDYTRSMEAAAATSKRLGEAEKAKNDVISQGLQETAKAAALSADSAEDAMERVVRAAFMEAVAKQIAKIISTVPFPFNIGLAAGAGAAMSGLFDGAMGVAKKLKFAQFGMNEMVSKPTLIMAGEAGPERVNITPASRPSSEQGGGGMTINFLGPVTDREFVRDTIIPEIQKVSNLGLA
tara:strand:+ start:41 stop:2011 length:1971 start_codon:yes stop_codon:yes gene_type:complete